jgi:ankyrin repeat protein
MSESIPERADIRQLRTQAKELLRKLQSGETDAEGITPEAAKLADAQRLIARDHGHSSWPKLVKEVELPILIGKFKTAVEDGDPVGLEKLLRTKPILRNHIDDPVFSFDAPAIVHAAHGSRAVEMLAVLGKYGADPNVRTSWWAGGFGALDHARGEAAQILLKLGAKYDIWSAAAHAQTRVLRELLEQDPTKLDAPGGDGGTPLHFAANAEVVKFLVALGADVERRDVDHEGTPIQHHIADPEMVRLLLESGATPDIFTAVALEILKDEPDSANAQVGQGDFATKNSEGGHIYVYKIGPAMTPHIWAAKLGRRRVLEALLDSATPSRLLVSAAWLGDNEKVRSLLARYPGVGKEMGTDARALADAAQAGRVETVELLLEAGIDPKSPGLDSGNALQLACWFGHVNVVRQLIGRVPIELKDPHHGSTPLGWAVHGSNWCRNPKGDYVAIVEALIEAGADATAAANSNGTSLLTQAGRREDVKEVLRRSGAQ